MEATEVTTAAELVEVLQDALAEAEVTDTRTFEEAGVLTRDDGLVVRTADGREFQVTVVRSR